MRTERPDETERRGAAQIEIQIDFESDSSRDRIGCARSSAPMRPVHTETLIGRLMRRSVWARHTGRCARLAYASGAAALIARYLCAPLALASGASITSADSARAATMRIGRPSGPIRMQSSERLMHRFYIKRRRLGREIPYKQRI